MTVVNGDFNAKRIPGFEIDMHAHQDETIRDTFSKDGGLRATIMLREDGKFHVRFNAGANVLDGTFADYREALIYVLAGM